MARKVAIVARGATAPLAPFNDPDWEVWGIPWVEYPRHPDRYFEIHSRTVFAQARGEYGEGKWIERANASDVPVWCHPSRVDDFKNPVAFPIEEVRRVVPIAFLENSIAYEMALAILEQRPAIALYGVHMWGKQEYQWERSSVTFWAGVALGRGIELTVAPGSPLFLSRFEAGRYGESPAKRF